MEVNELMKRNKQSIVCVFFLLLMWMKQMVHDCKLCFIIRKHELKLCKINSCQSFWINIELVCYLFRKSIGKSMRSFEKLKIM